MFGDVVIKVDVDTSRYAISVTPDLALDAGYTYAGGLGVLEGDKFYAAGRLGLRYVALTLFYRYGYVEWSFDDGENPVPKPQQQPEELVKNLSVEDRFKVKLRGEDVEVEALTYKYGSAKAVFFNVLSPERVADITSRIYVESNVEEKAYKYILFSKVAAEYIKRSFELDCVAYIDLQEAYTATLPLQLKIPGKYRLIIHTAGIWGHPSFPREVLERELGYKFIEKEVLLTEIGLAAAQQALAVSAKHYDVLRRIFPHFNEKLAYVTNGVNLERWTTPNIRWAFESRKLTLDLLIGIREKLVYELEKLLRSYKDITLENKLVVVWARRITEYKRPWMIAKLASELKDMPIAFIIGGKAHPHDLAGVEYMRVFRKMHREMPNVVFIHNYDVLKAKVLLSSGHLLLFTPFSGLEACGTSYMKAAINGVPSLAVRDGGVLEFVVDGINGWLFGEDLREPIDLHCEKAREINERDYDELKAKLLKIYKVFKEGSEAFYSIALSATRSFMPRVSMFRVLKEYYPDLVKTPLV
ncbi:MAG: glycogen/starch/alpha-glucan phosphorylase [Desulfurococcaceae archaeon]